MNTELANPPLASLEEQLALFSRRLTEFYPGDLQAMEDLITTLKKLVPLAQEIQNDPLYTVVNTSLRYAEIIPLDTVERMAPLEEARILMDAILRHIRRDEIFDFDTQDVLVTLNHALDAYLTPLEPPKLTPMAEAAPDPEPPKPPEPEPEPEPVTTTQFSAEDMEILMDFVTEAEENLNSIEVYLIELEQDPTDQEIINNIFRPFHSIKGVAGFLSLTKINQLAHSTESLLDSARSGDFIIEATATDAILESVDTLKELVHRIKLGAEKGRILPDNDVEINPLREKMKNLQVQLTQGEREPLGSILINKGYIKEKDLEETLAKQKEQPDKKIGELLVENNKVAPVQVAQALLDQAPKKKKIATQVKVNTEKLDDLVDYAGELVIAQSMLRQQTIKDPSLNQSVGQLDQIVSNMQHIAMSMRMIPIKSTFIKMIRLVRDLSKRSSKRISLTMSGEETEIDRNMVDDLYEPMVHMIRNAVDHGIESPEERGQAQKPATGSIHLNAVHKGGHIIIEIRDDGRGLDRDRILEKGIQAGLITDADQLSDSQIYDLILHPGFSTANQITDVSGRGVGMDVVKEGIEKLRGHLKIESEKGVGTLFTISLPLTMAIIDGMLVRVGQERFVIPTSVIQRAFKPEKENCFEMEGKGEIIKERDHLIPLVRLGEIYNQSKERIPPWEHLAVVVESKEEQKALLIDELLGKNEYVIKSLGGNFEDVQSFSGGAILADGRVGLILDINGIFNIAEGK